MKKRNLLLTIGLASTLLLSACGTKAAPAGNTEAGQTTAAVKKEVPTLNVGWSNELHTGNMHLNFLKPELFADRAIHLKPLNDKQLELIKDGEVIANINFIHSKGAAESVTMMSQGHMDLAYCSSTAIMTAYDSGVDVSVLCPIQSGGVAIVAAANAPYNTFEELVEYAKTSEKPIRGGYHSAISSPRIVLEYALRDAGLKVTENTADYEADVVLTDLKGISNLIPSMSSGQVEIWAGPVPNPQNAEAQNIGKIIARLDQLPEGKWVDFPCCTMNVMNSVKTKYPEVVAAMVQVTKDVSEYAQTHREETADLMTEFIGLDKAVLMKNDTTYQTAITEHFTNGMHTYYEAMSEIGKFTGRLKDQPMDVVMKSVFDFSFVK
ncbi:NMT1-like family protein [anaerobic digester metagenome]|nr:ABC transporter substrate-binding protein [Clostridiaceae bacterium HFYG-1003]